MKIRFGKNEKVIADDPQRDVNLPRSRKSEMELFALWPEEIALINTRRRLGSVELLSAQLRSRSPLAINAKQDYLNATDNTLKYRESAKKEYLAYSFIMSLLKSIVKKISRLDLIHLEALDKAIDIGEIFKSSSSNSSSSEDPKDSISGVDASSFPLWKERPKGKKTNPVEWIKTHHSDLIGAEKARATLGQRDPDLLNAYSVWINPKRHPDDDLKLDKKPQLDLNTLSPEDALHRIREQMRAADRRYKSKPKPQI